jgi:hypothetical protein
MNATRTARLARLAIAAPIAVTAMFGVSTTALADTSSTPFPGDRYCGFDVTMTTLTDNSKEIINPSGDRTTGHVVVQFTNTLTGASQTFNVSGASEAPVDNGNNTFTQVFTGPSWFAIGPQGRLNTGEPALLYSPGRTVVVYDTSGPRPVVQSFSPTAPVTNICALLAPPA